MASDKPTRYGFFSLKCIISAQHNSRIVYGYESYGRSFQMTMPIATVYHNSEGKEVFVTHIENSPNPITKWDDTVSHGPIVKWIRSATDAEVASLIAKDSILATMATDAEIQSLLKPAKYGVFSRKQAIHNYLLPILDGDDDHGRVSIIVWSNTEGKEVFVTQIAQSPREHVIWDDAVCVGQVTKFIRYANDDEVRSILKLSSANKADMLIELQNERMAPTKYGFFSRKHAIMGYIGISPDLDMRGRERRQRAAIVVYSNPKGKEVFVTEVSNSPTEHMWSDAVLVGPVSKWLREATNDEIITILRLRSCSKEGAILELRDELSTLMQHNPSSSYDDLD